jgi:hypothetical protein
MVDRLVKVQQIGNKIGPRSGPPSIVDIGKKQGESLEPARSECVVWQNKDTANAAEGTQCGVLPSQRGKLRVVTKDATRPGKRVIYRTNVANHPSAHPSAVSIHFSYNRCQTRIKETKSVQPGVRCKLDGNLPLCRRPEI